MSDKRKEQDQGAHGQLGQAFRFSRDDLAANRAGYMTLEQQWGFAFWERVLYGWALRLPPLKWLVPRAPRKAIKLSGRIKKHYHSKIIYTGSGGTGGGHQDVLEQRRIEITHDDGVMTFYVPARQFNALPDNNILVTLYYDAMEQRIVSVEPPYETAIS
ncbi:MAG: hypothetical protein ACFE0Q_18230 [Anaerolineae bacterium]